MTAQSNPLDGLRTSTTQGMRDAYSRAAARNVITDKQVAFLLRLAEERNIELTEEGIRATFTRQTASSEIDRLMRMPRAPRATNTEQAALASPAAKLTAHQESEDIFAALGGEQQAPPGKFALVNPTTGLTEFFQVDIPRKGTKWFGWVFVKALKGSPGYWDARRLRGAEAIAVCERIASDPAGAQALYGRKFQECGRCGAPLSNIRSRAAGYGWTCAGYRSWPYPTTEEARRILDELGIDYSDLTEEVED